ncbi:unnamed protein product [Phytophthora fragariaefolia]|uniref:Unnamed protein product n=1 Tax=Phytophthora fragariaefolia TaxID=1490495 RepID=A0A9W6TQ02_9STRA|nr:unnamed protein product [Phytophthora fragariaefolia]
MALRVDNQAAVKQLEGEGASAKAKHLGVRIEFVGDYTKRGALKPERSETPLQAMSSAKDTGGAAEAQAAHSRLDTLGDVSSEFGALREMPGELGGRGEASRDAIAVALVKKIVLSRLLELQA